jgi:hypothetical protein
MRLGVLAIDQLRKDFVDGISVAPGEDLDFLPAFKGIAYEQSGILYEFNSASRFTGYWFFNFVWGLLLADHRVARGQGNLTEEYFQRSTLVRHSVGHYVREIS